jgi:hypothetical protein
MTLAPIRQRSAKSDYAFRGQSPATTHIVVVTLLDKLNDAPARLGYPEKPLEHGWSCSVPIKQIRAP